jgi:hypothetical protein
MANLKDRLAQKVEVIETANPVSNNNNLVKENTDNIILLNPTEENQKFSVVPDFAITLNDAKARIEMLQSFVNEMMIPNLDYGFIPNCNKPSLFKSGAEKLCDIFGFSKQIEILNRVEDWDKALFHYEIKTILINKRTGLIEAEGIGSCNNRERKYKSQDGYSIINNILKMAKKRAFVDAVLSATRSSGIFTQDVEDINEHSKTKSYTKSTFDNKGTSKASYNSSTTTNKNTDKTSSTKALISKSQQSKLVSIINQNKMSISDVKELMQERYKVNESKNLSMEQGEDFIQYLKLYNAI